MQNFKVLFKVEQQYVDAIVKEIENRPDMWDLYPLRTKLLAKVGGPNEECNDILLQYTSLDAIKNGVVDVLETVSYPPFLILTAARRFVFALMSTLSGERLGRAFISKLKPGNHIVPHIDTHAFSKYYTRYHLSLKDNDKTLFRCGDEYFAPQVGQVFSFDNTLEHEVWNDGDTERWTLVVDIKKPILYTAPYEDIEFETIDFKGGSVTVKMKDKPTEPATVTPITKKVRKPRKKKTQEITNDK